jgi:hypothetical protein
MYAALNTKSYRPLGIRVTAWWLGLMACYVGSLSFRLFTETLWFQNPPQFHLLLLRAQLRDPESDNRHHGLFSNKLVYMLFHRYRVLCTTLAGWA